MNNLTRAERVKVLKDKEMRDKIAKLISGYCSYGYEIADQILALCQANFARKWEKFIPEAERLTDDTAHDELWKQGWNACRRLCQAKLRSRANELEAELLALHKIFNDYKESRISFGKCRELLAQAITTHLLGCQPDEIIRLGGTING